MHVNHALHARLRVAAGPVPIGRLADAVTRVTAVHAALGAPDGVPVELLPADAPPWPSLVTAALAEKIDRARPLRVLAAGRPDATDLVLVGDHSATDGTSTAVLLADVVAALRGETPPPPRAAPTVAELVAHHRPDLAADLGPPSADVLRALADAPAPAPVRLTPGALPADVVDRVRARGRRDGVRLHAALVTAFAGALDDVEGIGDHPRTISTPVSVRGLLPPERRRAAGLYLTTVPLVVVGDGWRAARAVQADLEAATTPDRLLERVAASAAAFTRGLPRPAHDLSLTNLGPLEVPARGADLRVDEVHGPLVNALPGERTVGVTTLAGRLSWTVATFTDEHDDGWARALLAAATARLHALADDVGT